MCERDYRTDIYYKNINGNYVKSYYKNYRVGRINMSDRRIDYENLVIPLSISLIDII
jgi:hypothetical protein